MEHFEREHHPMTTVGADPLRASAQLIVPVVLLPRSHRVALGTHHPLRGSFAAALTDRAAGKPQRRTVILE